ncbi:MAG: endodeoxyribonuclease [Lentimicrobiaceae bacterium]|jgi:hypothetical protein|nr:endodeoxyribonuclease [Lentimicrobiaceae bacterium]|tara:strand:+ start:384 stop:824 length:441 start_codon:yes stop_codon:yes gene_type:complete
MTKRTFKRFSREEGYRSGLEKKIADELKADGVDFRYEPKGWVTYNKPTSKYKPDFVLENGIVIEAKGQFLSSDRTKHKLIKEQHPDLDIRFVFSNSKTTIGSKSRTTYAMWCNRYEFEYADRSIPREWINEKPTTKRMKGLRVLDK